MGLIIKQLLLHEGPPNVLGLSLLALFSILLFTPHISYSGIEEFAVVISPNKNKHVILAGEIHKKSPGSQTNRLANAIAEGQKNDPYELDIYIENPCSLFVTSDSSELTVALPRKIKELNIPQVNFHNCEIRNIALLAFWIFHQRDPYFIEPDTQVESAGKTCIAGSTTLTDLENEFETFHDELSSFAPTLLGNLKICYLQKLRIARDQMKKFQDTIAPHIHPTNYILSTAEQIFDNHKKIWPEIEDLVFYPFAHLLELKMIKTIYTSKKSKLLFLAGQLHTSKVYELLSIANWEYPNSEEVQRSENVEAIDFNQITKITSSEE